MNKDNILKLAQIIESQPHTGKYDLDGFNMGHWKHSCGTPSCIAGWAAQEYANEQGLEYPVRHRQIEDYASQWLSVKGLKQEKLFIPYLEIELSQITPKMAAKTLRKLARTGEVEWRNSRNRRLEI